MSRIVLLSLIMLAIACNINPIPIAPAKELYSDSTGFNIKMLLPEDWPEDKKMLQFLDDVHLFQGTFVKGDTSCLLTVDIDFYANADARAFRIDSLIAWQLGMEPKDDTTFRFLHEGRFTTASGKNIGYYDGVVTWFKGPGFQRKLVFFCGQKVGVVEITACKKWDEFKKIADQLGASIEYCY